MTCTYGSVSEIVFASYGTPNGAPGPFTYSSCSSGTSMSVCSAKCLGKTSCSYAVNNGLFGDPW